MATVTASSSKLYSNALAQALNGNLNLATSTIKVMFCTASYTPNQTTHIYKDVSVTNECTGTNYTAGGYTLGTKTITPSGLTVTFDAADVSQAGAVITGIRYLVIYNDTPASNKPLICYIDLGTATDCDGQLTIAWNASGIFTITVA